MGVLLAFAIGALTAAAVYLFLARDYARLLVGFVLLGTAANLAVFASGRIGSMTPPLVAPGAEALAADAANPLPQALVLTAIVIGFGLAAFTLLLVVSAQRTLGTIAAEEMRHAEGDAETSEPAVEPAPTPVKEAA